MSEAEHYADGSSVWPTEDGGYVAFDSKGAPTGAVDANGDPTDFTEYVHPDLAAEDDGEEYDDDLRGELDELREEIENLPDPYEARQAAYEAGAAASGERADEQWAVSTGRELRNLETRLGRALTQTETWAILGEARGDFEAGIAAEDLGPAVDRAGVIGYSPGRDLGLTDHQHGEARRAFMGQLIEDAGREERGETPDDGPEWIEPASNDAGDVRRANLANAANGYEVDFSNNEEEY